MVRQFDRVSTLHDPRPKTVFPVKEVGATPTNPVLLDAQAQVKAAVGQGLLKQNEADFLVKKSNNEVAASAVLTNKIAHGQQPDE